MLKLDREALGTYADWSAVAIAVALPWSTTLTYLFIVGWLIALIGSWDCAERFRERWMLAGALPVALWLLAMAGMTWANVPLSERFAGFNSFHKLLAIPFLAVQFRDSGKGMRVLIAFLLSCTVMLILSWGLILLTDLPWRGRHRFGGVAFGIPVKDRNAQSTMFTLCILGLAEASCLAWLKENRWLALGFALSAGLFFANMLYAETSRTALVATPVLLLLFASRRLRWKGAAGLLIAMIALSALIWLTSAQLRQRVVPFLDELRNYQPNAAPTSAGERIEYWRKSVTIVQNAPIFGHGTGSIHEQFREAAAGQTGMAGLASADPHNQIFATAIQLGIVGTAVLLAMWTAHLLFFWVRRYQPGSDLRLSCRI